VKIQEYLSNEWRTLVIMASIFVGAIVLTRFFRWIISKSLHKDADRHKIDPTRYKFFKNAVSFIIWLIAIAAIIYMIPKLRALAVTLFAGAGILLAAIGFAAQEAFSNIVNGIFIVLFKPFRVGDMIKVSGLDYGIVEDITLRHTVIINFENKRLIIPNSVISSDVIVNDTIEDQKVCRWIEVGISYDSDVDKASRIIQEEAMKHPKTIDNRTAKEKKAGEDPVEIRLLDFGDFSVNLRAYVWTKDPYNALRMHSDINKAIKKRFDAEGIEIPFPYRTLVFKKDIERDQNGIDEDAQDIT
jgi:small conductance mechanosensitive channel